MPRALSRTLEEDQEAASRLLGLSDGEPGLDLDLGADRLLHVKSVTMIDETLLAQATARTSVPHTTESHRRS